MGVAKVSIILITIVSVALMKACGFPCDRDRCSVHILHM